MKLGEFRRRERWLAGWLNDINAVLCEKVVGSHLRRQGRTGYLTLTSPKAMFFSQVVGALMGIIFSPLTFQLYW